MRRNMPCSGRSVGRNTGTSSWWPILLSPSTAEEPFDIAAEHEQHEHVHQQVRPVGMHERMGDETVPLPARVDHVGLEQ